MLDCSGQARQGADDSNKGFRITARLRGGRQPAAHGPLLPVQGVRDGPLDLQELVGFHAAENLPVLRDRLLKALWPVVSNAEREYDQVVVLSNAVLSTPSAQAWVSLLRPPILELETLTKIAASLFCSAQLNMGSAALKVIITVAS